MRKIAKAAALLLGLAALAAGGFWYLRSPGNVAATVTPPQSPPQKVSAAMPKSPPAPAAEALPEPAAQSATVAKRELVELKKEARGPSKKPAPAKTAAKSETKRAEKAPEPRPAPTPEPVPQQAAAAPTAGDFEATPPAKPVLEVKSVTDLDALVKQFEKSPRYATALQIAKIHFERGDYEAASAWARRANRIDRDDEKAWILYAQAEYALGRKERAKRILRLYLDYRDSAEAKALLMGWSKP